MKQDIKTPAFKDLDKIFYDNLVKKAEDALTNQHDDEDIEDAIQWS